jgi:hypothetical protein
MRASVLADHFPDVAAKFDGRAEPFPVPGSVFHSISPQTLLLRLGFVAGVPIHHELGIWQVLRQ